MKNLHEEIAALGFELVPPTCGSFVSINSLDFQRDATLIRVDDTKWEHIIHLPDPYCGVMREVVESVGFGLIGLCIYLHHIGKGTGRENQETTASR